MNFEIRSTNATKFFNHLFDIMYAYTNTIIFDLYSVCIHMSKKRLVTVRVTEIEYQWLFGESKRLGVSISEVLRDLVKGQIKN